MDRDRFPSTQAKRKPITGFTLGLMIGLLLLVLALVVSAVFWPLGLAISVAALLAPIQGLWLSKGPCPHCAEAVTIYYKATCHACKHRLILRQGRIVDIT